MIYTVTQKAGDKIVAGPFKCTDERRARALLRDTLIYAAKDESDPIPSAEYLHFAADTMTMTFRALDDGLRGLRFMVSGEQFLLTEGEEPPHEYLFDVDLKASIRVKARSEEEARKLLCDALDCADANLGATADGQTLTCEVSAQYARGQGPGQLVEVDGKDV